MSDDNDKRQALRASQKDERARDAARAMQEISNQRQAELARTARLRALRLANVAQTTSDAAKQPKTPAIAKKKSK
jgi:hypothetical protein